MQTRKLGWTDLELTQVGLGTWAMGNGNYPFGWGPQDEKESIAAVHRALDMGVNWIDTAPIYGLGLAEEVVGRALKGAKSRPLLATKCGIVWDDRRKISNNLTKASIRREAEASLSRLGAEVLDLYQIHWPNPEEQIEQAWEAMGELIEEGKVRYAGVSNFDVMQMERVNKIRPVASLQPPYSMLERDVEKEILDYCGMKDIGVVAYSPLQRGLLSGKFTKERLLELPSDDHRPRTPHYKEPAFSINLQLTEALRPLARRRGLSVAQFSIAWVLRRPEVTSAIVGARRPSQIEETAAQESPALEADDVREVETLLEERARALSS